MGVLWSKQGSHHRYHHHNHRLSLPSGQTPQSQQLSSDTNTNTNNNIPNIDPHNNYTQQCNNPIPSSSFSTNPVPPTTPPLPPPPSPQPPTYAAYNFQNFQFRPLPPPPPLLPAFSSLSSGWVPYRPHGAPAMITGPPQPVAPPVYVDHNHAKKIKNDVNVHKHSIRVVPDESKFGDSLVSFTFDALVDGSISIFYFAKEGTNCTFMPLYPEMYLPRKIPFKKGLGQKFCQSSGTGIDLGFFELDDLSKPSPKEDVFPLVISAEACSPSFSGSTEHEQSLSTVSPHAQITQAVLEKSKEGPFQVKVVKQILWVDGVRYELREIYGIGNNDEASFDNNQSGEECVICMTEPKDTAVLPCRHMCLCNECAKELRLQSKRCPICRQPIEELMEIKLDKDGPPAR